MIATQYMAYSVGFVLEIWLTLANWPILAELVISDVAEDINGHFSILFHIILTIRQTCEIKPRKVK